MPTPKPKKKAKVGKPRLEIDWGKVERLHTRFPSDSTVAYIMGISIETLTTRPEYAEYKKKGQAMAELALRDIQFKHAENNPAMAMFLGKVLLGQSETAGQVENKANTQLENLARVLSEGHNRYAASLTSGLTAERDKVEARATKKVAGASRSLKSGGGKQD